MRRTKEAVIMIGMTLMAVTGCSRSDIKPITIDDHVFNVPEKYLVSGTIPWLPESQDDGLMFHINPEAPLPDRVSVLIQSKAITCRPGEPLGATPLAAACQAAASSTALRAGVSVRGLHTLSRVDNLNPTLRNFGSQVAHEFGVRRLQSELKMAPVEVFL